MVTAPTPEVPTTPDPYVVVGAMYDVPNIEGVLNKMWPAGYRLVTAVPQPQNTQFLTLIFELRERSAVPG